MALNFIPNVEGKPEVNHINGIKTDNRVVNLEWCTGKENMQNAISRDSVSRGISRHNAILTFETAEEIRKIYKSQNISFTKLGKMYGVTRHCIRQVVNRLTWRRE